MCKRVYIVGSLHNEKVTALAADLRTAGYEVFDDWHCPGPDTDDYWKEYEQERGRSYVEALQGRHAKNVVNYDLTNITRADICVLLLPAGKSGHMEIGWAAREPNTETHIVLDPRHDPPWDVMYGIVDHVWSSPEQFVAWMGARR